MHTLRAILPQFCASFVPYLGDACASKWTVLRVQTSNILAKWSNGILAFAGAKADGNRCLESDTFHSTSKFTRFTLLNDKSAPSPYHRSSHSENVTATCELTMRWNLMRNMILWRSVRAKHVSGALHFHSLPNFLSFRVRNIGSIQIMFIYKILVYYYVIEYSVDLILGAYVSR